MTAQISDEVLLEGDEYQVAGFGGEGLFDPKMYGIELINNQSNQPQSRDSINRDDIPPYENLRS